MRCNSCETLMINGVFCHETGCPDSWKGYTKACEWCGEEFKPEYRNQETCSNECYKDYWGLE